MFRSYFGFVLIVYKLKKIFKYVYSGIKFYKIQDRKNIILCDFPFKIIGSEYISIGENSSFGKRCVLTAWENLLYENKEKIFAIIWITDTENGDDYRFFLEESGYMLGKTTDDQDVYYSPETNLLVFFTEIENITQIEIYPFKEK